jgi:cytochrome c556
MKSIGIALVAAVAAGAVTSAQKNPYLRYTEEKFVDNKLTADRNYAAVKTFTAGADYASAKAQLTRAREQMAITITFWRDANNDAAVAMLRKTLTSMDNLDVVMSAEKIDAAGVTSAVAQIDQTCTACHAAYREQDPATNSYRVRRSSR